MVEKSGLGLSGLKWWKERKELKVWKVVVDDEKRNEAWPRF